MKDGERPPIGDVVGGPAGIGARFFGEVEGAIAIPIMPKAVDLGFSQPFELVLSCPDINKLVAYQTELANRLRKAGFLANVRGSVEITKPELRVEIARDRASALGVSIADISRTLQILFSGQDLAAIKRDGRQYDVIVQLERERRLTPADLDRIFVPGSGGKLVQLSNVVLTREGAGPNKIERFNRQRSTTIQGTPAGIPLGTAMDRVEDMLTESLPAGITYSWKGESLNLRESSGEIYFFLLLLAFLLPAPAAERQILRQVSLPEAMQLAMEHSPVIARARAVIKTQLGVELSAKAEFLPMINARSAYKLAIERLREAAGVEYPEGLDGSKIQLTSGWPPGEQPHSLEAALKTAAVKRPELAADIADIEQTRQALAVEISRTRPTVAAATGYGFQSRNFSDDITSDPLHGWTIGVEMRVPLFDPGQARGRRMQAEARVETAEMAARERQLAVEGEVRAALLAVEEAREILASAGLVVKQADEALRLARAGFDAGAGTQLEVLESRFALTQARLNSIQATHQYHTAAASLRRASGEAP